MNRVVVRSRNPHDIHLDEAEDLAQSLRRLFPNQVVEVEGKEQVAGRYGITWFQIIDILLSGIAVAVVEEVTKVAIEWARARFNRKGGTSRRPVYIPIYGPDGKILKSVVIKNAVDEPEDRTEIDRKLFQKKSDDMPR